MDLEKKLKDEGKWNLWWDACFVVAVTLVLLTWPLPSGQLIGTLPSTEAFFMFSVTNTQKNTTAGIGYVELRGVGGLSVDNKLTLTVKLDLTGNASDPIL
ncbi:MAG TPA: hypothetical protein VGS04_07710, partial [Nitrososphaerales archaeon]|nr:hypothetical protein [Nitrososphaerales archaeon]